MYLPNQPFGKTVISEALNEAVKQQERSSHLTLKAVRVIVTPVDFPAVIGAAHVALARPTVTKEFGPSTRLSMAGFTMKRLEHP